jgi:hypothetical protein
MQTNSLAVRPTAIYPDSSAPAMTSTRPGRQRPAIVKLLPAPTPPDEKMVKALNELAARPPFCTLHKVKKYDAL